MRAIIVGLFLSTTAASLPAYAQLSTRADTLAHISRKMAPINKENQEIMTYTGKDDGYIERRLNDLLEMVAGLRDDLAGNKFVRLSSVTVNVPWGVSVEFSLPEPETPDKP